MTSQLSEISNDAFTQIPIWEVPQAALDWGFENREHVYAGSSMILPAEEVWRDSAHYKAYVRPTKEEDA